METVRMAIRNFPETTRRLLNAFCAKHDLSQAEVLDRALREYLKTHK